MCQAMRTSCSTPVAHCRSVPRSYILRSARHNAHRWASSQQGEGRAARRGSVKSKWGCGQQRRWPAELICKEIPMPAKRVQFDEETWNALDPLGRDRMQDFQTRRFRTCCASTAGQPI